MSNYARCLAFVERMERKAHRRYVVQLDEVTTLQLNRCVIDVRNLEAGKHNWMFSLGSIIYDPAEGHISGEVPTTYDHRNRTASRVSKCGGVVTDIHTDNVLAHVHFYAEDPQAILCLRDKLLEEP